MKSDDASQDPTAHKPRRPRTEQAAGQSAPPQQGAEALTAFMQETLKAADAALPRPGIIGQPDEAVAEGVARALSRVAKPEPRTGADLAEYSEFIEFAQVEEHDDTAAAPGISAPSVGNEAAAGSISAAAPAPLPHPGTSPTPPATTVSAAAAADPAAGHAATTTPSTTPTGTASAAAAPTATASAERAQEAARSTSSPLAAPTTAPRPGAANTPPKGPRAAHALKPTGHSRSRGRGRALAVVAAAAVIIGVTTTAVLSASESHGSHTANAGSAHGTAASGSSTLPVGVAGDASGPAGTTGATAPGAASSSANGSAPTSSTGAGAGAAHPGAQAGSGANSAPTTLFNGIAGYGCTNSTAASFVGVGFSGGGSDDWIVVPGNDGTGSGCSNGFLSMPMSGTATQDGANRGLWVFDVAASAPETCSVRVYIPLPHSASTDYEVGGTSALYGVFAGTSTSSATQIASFVVNQTQHRGGSVLESGFTVNQPLLVVRLFDRGVDYTSTPNLMYGVAAVRATCTRA